MDGDIGALGIPERRERILRSFEGKHALSCLLYIGDFGPVLRTEIYRDVSGGAGMAERIDVLKRLGLAEEYRRGRSCYIGLTPKGRCVVSTLRLMLDIAEGCPDRENETDSVMEALTPGDDPSET